MKKRKIERAERRRPLVELNLLGETRSRSSATSRGCAALLGRLLGGTVFILLLKLGLG